MSNNKLYKTDTNAVLRFYEMPDKNNFASERAGKPVFDTVLMAEIITPGQSASTLEVEIERVFTPIDGSENRKVRRSKYYDKYQAQVEAHKNETGEYVDDGMPIRNWAQIDRGLAETLAAQGIYTVEALAGISDTALTSVGLGARTLRDQAKAYLVSREFGIPSSQMAAENATLAEENKRQAEEIAQLKLQLSQYEAAASATKTPKSAKNASNALV